MAKTPVPIDIKLHKQSKTLELVYATEQFTLTCEYLRVYSPSAEVRGHGAGQEVLQTGKINVAIDAISAGIDDLKHSMQFPPQRTTSNDIKVWKQELEGLLLQRAALTRRTKGLPQR